MEKREFFLHLPFIGKVKNNRPQSHKRKGVSKTKSIFHHREHLSLFSSGLENKLGQWTLAKCLFVFAFLPMTIYATHIYSKSVLS